MIDFGLTEVRDREIELRILCFAEHFTTRYWDATLNRKRQERKEQERYQNDQTCSIQQIWPGIRSQDEQCTE